MDLSRFSAKSATVLPPLVRPTLPRIGDTIAEISNQLTKPITFESKIVSQARSLASLSAEVTRIANPLASLGCALTPLRETISTMQMASQRWNDQINAVHRQITSHLSIFDSSFLDLQCAVEPIVAQFKTLHAAVTQNTFSILKSHKNPIAEIGDWHRSFIKSITPLWTHLAFPSPDFAPVQEYLVERSWYVSLDLPLSIALDLRELFESEDFEEIEIRLAEWISASLLEIEHLLAQEHPHRKHIFKDAFEAHRQGRFTLSIPAFLAQVDGLSHDIWNVAFFCSRESMTHIERLLTDSPAISVFREWLAPLTKRGTVRENTKRLPPGRQVFNRHNVLHGLCADYSSELNSLKCIALLEFLRSVGSLFREEELSKN